MRPRGPVSSSMEKVASADANRLAGFVAGQIHVSGGHQQDGAEYIGNAIVDMLNPL